MGNRYSATLAGLLLGGVVFGADVNLLGSITDNAGAPIEGARVYLMGEGLEAQTDASGLYSIQHLATTDRAGGPAAQTRVALNNARISLSLPAPTHVTVSAFDTRGGLVSSAVDGIFPAGKHSLPVFDEGMSAGLSVVRVRAGGETCQFKYLCMERARSGSPNADAAALPFRKTAAAVDTLQASKSGYVTKLVPLDSYTGTVDIELAQKPSDVVTVSSMADLVAKVNAAPPGRHILIAAGTYNGGALSFNNDGTQAKPIVIRPRDGIGTVTINGANWELAAGSSWLKLTQLYFDSNSQVVISGAHHVIERCRFCGINRKTVHPVAATDLRITRCDFSGYADGDTPKSCINFDPHGFDDGTNVRCRIDHCYFHDMNPAGGRDNSEVIQMYGQVQNFDLSIDVCTVDSCLFENIHIEGEGELISIKSGGWTLQFNTFVNCGHYISTRHGNNCTIRSNWFEGMAGRCFNLFGENHLFIGNRVIGGLSVRIPAGKATTAEITGGAEPIVEYVRSFQCRVIGNRMGSGYLEVGGYWGSGGQSLPAMDNNLYNNTRDSGGNAYTLIAGWEQGTTFNVDNEPYEAAVKLTASEVGLDAPGL